MKSYVVRYIFAVLLAALCGLLMIRPVQAQCSGEDVIIGVETSGTPTIEEFWDFAVEAGNVIFGTTNGSVTATHTLRIGPSAFVTANNSGTCDVDHPDNTAGFTINKTGILKFETGEITALFLKVTGPSAGEAALGGKLIGAGKFIFPAQSETTQAAVLQSALVNPVGVLTFQVADAGDDVILSNSVYRVGIGSGATNYLNVTNGDVQLTNTKLAIDFPAGFSANEGDQFTIMKIGGTRTGVFLNANGTALNEGATVTVNGVALKITYAGGASGKDIVLKKEAPSLSLTPALTLNEGNGGTANATITVTLSSASAQTVTVNYATSNGTATAGQDYTATNGTLTFAPGQTQKTINVPILGDVVSEKDETLTLALSAPVNAPLSTPSTATITIIDDDANPSFTVSSPRAFLEGSASAPGSTTFAVRLSPASGRTVFVSYQTANGVVNGAVAGQDYVAQSGTLTFTAGQTLKTVTVPFIGESTAELNETFFLDIKTPINATITNSRGKAFIGNDDGPSISIDNATSVTEGNSGTRVQNFVVKLSAASTNTITVSWATGFGPSTGGAGPADFTVATGTLSFAPGETSKTIGIQIKGDTTVEPNEKYFVNLTRPTFAIIADSQGSGFILNDDTSAGLVAGDEPSK